MYLDWSVRCLYSCIYRLLPVSPDCSLCRGRGSRWGTNGHLWSLPSSRGPFSGGRLAFPGRQALHSIIRGATCGGAGVGLALDDGGPEVLTQLDARTSLTQRPVLPGPRLHGVASGVDFDLDLLPEGPSSSAEPFSRRGSAQSSADSIFGSLGAARPGAHGMCPPLARSWRRLGRRAVSLRARRKQCRSTPETSSSSRPTSFWLRQA